MLGYWTIGNRITHLFADRCTCLALDRPNRQVIAKLELLQELAQLVAASTYTKDPEECSVDCLVLESYHAALKDTRGQ